MLSSLPPLWPQDAQSLYYSSLSTHHLHPSQSPQQALGPHATGRPPQHPGAHPPTRTFLSVLRADENAVVNRKANIRRFGAGWLRPPGVLKTLQGMADERAEREEQESAAQREFALAEAQAAAEAEALEREQQGMVVGEGEGQLERDLDDEVPDADEDDMGDDWVDDEQEMGDEGLLPGLEDEGEGDYGDEGGGRDLDDDVPEAGSYQHTDTDVEDDDSDDGPLPTPAFREVGNTGGRGVLGSSVFGSSPVVRAQREVRRSRGGGRRSEN